jgi:putative membrane protein insertion efficiency factor
VMGRSTGNVRGLSSLVGALMLGAIRAYRMLVSPLLGGHCRFHPSCSAYAEEAVTVHGPARGLKLAALRLLRCHPFHAGGVDPVPENPR